MEIRGDRREEGVLEISVLRVWEREEEREAVERETSREREWERERWWREWKKGVMTW